LSLGILKRKGLKNQIIINMKSKIFLWILLLIALKAVPQSSKIVVSQNEKTIGKNFILGKEIIAKEYIFPKRIHKSYIDSTSNNITLQLRKLSKNGKVLNPSGTLLVLGLNNKNVKWTKNMEFTTSYLDQVNDVMILSKGNKSNCLNIETGEDIWELKTDFYYMNPAIKIGIGYKYKGLAGNIHTLEGVNLNNGNILWEKELNREYGWNRKLNLNDSTLLIVSGGLHTINIKDGLGWDFNMITGKKDYTKTVAKNAVGVALGVLTGTFITSSGPNLVRDIVSNVLIDSSSIYMASKEKIARIDKFSGNIIWSHPLPEELTSKSSIFIKDSIVCLLNLGYANWGNKKIDFGKPFIAAFNNETGKELYVTTLHENKNPMLDFKIQKDTVLLIFKDKLVKYSLKNGSELISKSFDIDEFGALSFFIGNSIYLKKNSLFINVAVSDTANCYVRMSKGKILMLNNKLETVNQFNFEDLYFLYKTTKKHKFFSKGDQTVIFDDKNQKIAELYTSYDSVVIGNKLYDIQDKSFIEVNLSEIIGY